MAAHVPYKYNPGERSTAEMEATFVGRTDVLERLVTLVREQTGAASVQHCLLQGPPGVGKTTLLLVLQERVKQDPELAARWLTVRLREEEFYVYTLRDWLCLVLEALQAEEGVAEAGPVLAEAEACRGDDESLAVLLSGLRRIAQGGGRQVLLLIDNLDRVFPENIRKGAGQGAFGRLLASESCLMVVGASPRLSGDAGPLAASLPDLFLTIPVENLSEEEVGALLRRYASLEDDREFTPGFGERERKVRAITCLTGANPRVVLMLYEILGRRDSLPAARVLRETMDNLTPVLKRVLESLPRQQSKTLDALMRASGAASPREIAGRCRLTLNAVTTQLVRLRDAGFVEAEGGGKGKPASYRVRDPVFRTWYQMRYLPPSRRRAENLVEFLRAWFRVEERLGQREDLRPRPPAAAAADPRHLARSAARFVEDLTACGRGAGGSGPEQGADGVPGAADWSREAALELAAFASSEAPARTAYDAGGHAALVAMLWKREKPEKALQVIETDLRRDPGSIGARTGRAVCLGLLGNHLEAFAELSGVIAAPGLGVRDLAFALGLRGLARRGLGDGRGEIADCTAAMALAEVPPELLAGVQLRRAFSRGKQGDEQGALADFTGVIDRQGAGALLLVRALLGRGLQRGALGDLPGLVADLSALLDLPDSPPDLAALALLVRGAIHRIRGDALQAMADLGRGAESGAEGRSARRCLAELIPLLCGAGRLEEAEAALIRLRQLENETTAWEERIEARLEILASVAGECSPAFALSLMEKVLASAEGDVGPVLAFLGPALALANTGEEAALDNLDREEREIARRIARQLQGPRNG